MPDPTHSANPAPSMRRVRKLHRRLRQRPDERTIHQLRVSLRRCRTIATGLALVDPDPVWRRIRRRARRLFRALGPTRDAQVLGRWVRRLAAQPDDLGQRVLKKLARRERKGSRRWKATARRFDRKGWKELSRRAEKRFHRLPFPRQVLAHLVLESWTTVTEDHLLAMRENTATQWHRTRISLKRFRYTGEAFAPRSLRRARTKLRFLQDALGDVHDLDVLSELFEMQAKPLDGASLLGWRARILRVREQRLSDYRRRTERADGLWPKLRRRLLDGRRLEAASTARLIAQARLSGYRVTLNHRELLRARIWLDRRLKNSPDVDRQRGRRLLAAAGRLRHSAQKAPDPDLCSLQRPLGWSREDQEIVARAIHSTHREASLALDALTPSEQRLAQDIATALERAGGGDSAAES